MIEPDISPTRIDMTGFAGIGRLKMRRVLTGRRGAIMTTETRSGDTSMIKTRCCPALSIMARITLVRSFRMLGALPYYVNIVVATETRSGYRVVVYPKNGCPGLRRVAITT